MGDQDSRASREGSLGETFFEDTLADMRVHGRERVVQKHDVRIRVSHTRKTDTRFLTTAKVDSLFANLRLLALREHLKVGVE